ncbi:MAG: family 10 glycosylhydrolase, partial [Spirulinaceae cyanobacterium]
MKSPSKTLLLKSKPARKRTLNFLVTGLMTMSGLVSQCLFSVPASAQIREYCRFNAQAITEKENLRQAWVKGDANAEASYQNMLKKHGDLLNLCRSRNWPRSQGIWLRLHPCDAKSGVLEQTLDRIVNLGYNEVYIETFGNSQVLLPVADNPTPWLSMLRTPGDENRDLLAEVIEKGRKRGLKVNAWMFSMNFGYAYGQNPQTRSTLALNGQGDNSLAFDVGHSEAFIDPYNSQARQQYSQLVREVVKRKPDEIMFDYIRYPRGTGAASVASKVKDLWIYGDASRETLLRRSLNNRGKLLIEKYLSRGSLTSQDFQDMVRLYPDEGPPLWQGRTPTPQEQSQLDKQSTDPAQTTKLVNSIYDGALRNQIQQELWSLSVAHAAQGVIDFLSLASRISESQGIPAGAVFFPYGNRGVGQQGYDSRLQPWDQFPDTIRLHPMSYAVCNKASCIVDEVEWVMKGAKNKTNKVMPVLAGVWGASHTGRPSLEIQMAALRQEFPQINAVSHFAFSW